MFLFIGTNTLADSHIDFTLSDFCYLQPNVQERDGDYFFPNQEIGITASSLCVWKNAYGQYHSKGKLVNGKQEGKWLHWNWNGKKTFDENYKNGKLDGKGIYWDATGMEESIYSNGVRIESIRFNNDGQIINESQYEDGELSYEAFNTYHDNGKLRMKGNHIWPEIDFDGTITSWYKNGQKENESFYSEGELIGKGTWWYKNGQLMSEFYWSKDGSFNGIDRNWHENGQLQAEVYFTNGESTEMKQWHDTGELEFYYIYPDGKKTGNYTKLNKSGQIYYEATFKDGQCISGDC